MFYVTKRKQCRKKFVLFSSRAPNPFLLLGALDFLSTYLRVDSLEKTLMLFQHQREGLGAGGKGDDRG